MPECPCSRRLAMGYASVWLVVPDRYCDRDRSTRRRFAGCGVPTSVSECLEGDIGLADGDVRFCQPVVDLPIDCEFACR